MPITDIPNFKDAETWFWRLGQKHPKSFAIGFFVTGILVSIIVSGLWRWLKQVFS